MSNLSTTKYNKLFRDYPEFFSHVDETAMLDHLQREIKEYIEADSSKAKIDELGDMIMLCFQLARYNDVDPAQVVDRAVSKYRVRLEISDMIEKRRQYHRVTTFPRSTKQLCEDWEQAKKELQDFLDAENKTKVSSGRNDK